MLHKGHSLQTVSTTKVLKQPLKRLRNLGISWEKTFCSYFETFVSSCGQNIRWYENCSVLCSDSQKKTGSKIIKIIFLNFMVQMKKSNSKQSKSPYKKNGIQSLDVLLSLCVGLRVCECVLVSFVHL